MIRSVSARRTQIKSPSFFFFAVAVVAKGGDGKLNLLAFMFSNVIFKI